MRERISCLAGLGLLMLCSLKFFNPDQGTPSPEVLDFTITHYGPNMRCIQDALQEPTGPERHIETAVRNLRPSALDYIVRTQGGFDVTHSLIMSFASPRAVDATDPTYFRSDELTHSVANGHIWRLLLASFTHHEHLKTGHMILSFTSIPQASATADWLFETWAHRELSQGGERKLYPMQEVGQKLQRTTDETQALTISLPTLNPQVYISKDKKSPTQGSDMYYIPSDANNPTFDSFLRHEPYGIGFQMTVGSTHSLVSAGLKELGRRIADCDKRFFVFVIPSGQSFSCPAPAKSTSVPTFHYFTLELDPTKGMSIVLIAVLK